MEITWSIAQLERNALDGFVAVVHYCVDAVDGDYLASTYGAVSYTQGEESFVPFDQLTKETVIGWVKESLGADTVEASLISQIEAQKTPAVIVGFPWVAEELADGTAGLESSD